MKFLLFTIFILSVLSHGFSQNLSFNVDWGSDTLFSNNRKHIVVCSDFYLENKAFYLNVSLSDNLNDSYALDDYVVESLTDEEETFLKINNFVVDTFVNFQSLIIKTHEKSSVIGKISLFFVKNNKYYKILKFTLLKSESITNNLNKRSVHPSNSVLGDKTSSWYKFKVTKAGFYKLGFKDLVNLGYDPSKYGFNSFHIYGNSYGKLPELNSDYKDLDLLQMSLIYVGDEDGTFDSNDYIVFYSPGPNIVKTKLMDTLYERDLNIYSDYTAYFLRVNSNISPKKVLKKDFLSLTPTYYSSEMDVYLVHEEEDTSLVYGGKRWYGELFDNILTRSINFPSINNSVLSGVIKLSGATNSRASGDYLNFYSGETLLNSALLPSVSSEYIRLETSFNLSKTTSVNGFSIAFKRKYPDSKFFLDKVEINCRMKMVWFDGLDFFSDKKSWRDGALTQFTLSGVSSGSFVVDITIPTSPILLSSKQENIGISFNDSTNVLKRYSILNFNNLTPLDFKFELVESQNLHSLDYVDMLIVSPREFLTQARELKSIHNAEGLKVEVVEVDKIYNEFSSGSLDPSAIRQFAKSIYEKHVNDSENRLKYLLLFGDGTFDPKNRIKNNNNFIPTYQFDESEDFLSAMVSDDYFGMMDDHESILGTDMLDIGVGRLLISTQEQARIQIEKIKKYLANQDSVIGGDWKTKVLMIADDEENGYFINNDTEPQSAYLQKTHPEVNIIKNYADAFQQITTAGGERYPDLNESINKQIFQGVLVFSYVGHGGPSGAGEERFITIEQVSKWKNIDKLPLFVTSTCEFTKYDDPTRVSAGEALVLNPDGGAIALMTTTRPVFFGVNTISGESFYKNVFKKDSISGKSLTFGDIFMRTKNQSGTSSNRRSFTLIGDPALRIALPDDKIKLDSINGVSTSLFKDTISSLSKVKISGSIVDKNGVFIKQNGVLDLTFYDKPRNEKTLGQNVTSPIIDFKSQNSVLFKGAATLKDGRFNIEFIVPKDISYEYGRGKFSFTSSYSDRSAIGYDDSVMIGGNKLTNITDSIGPEIHIQFNNENEANNSTITNSPILNLNLFDESGINVTNSGIGHQMTLILDNNTQNTVDLSGFYKAERDTYKKGKVSYPLGDLSTGSHTLKVKAWDVYNNSSEKEVRFSVVNSSDFMINRVLNYPNPFTTKTEFYIEQNQIGVANEVRIEIFTISGKIVKTIINTNVPFTTSFLKLIDWDGKDDEGDNLAKGVYFYRVSVKSINGKTQDKLEKLVIF